MYYVDTNGIPCNWEFAYYIWSEDIIKHSKNIIDLIEIGDYVNYESVGSVDEKEMEIGEGWTVKEKDIKNILTKEQYAANSYKLKED